MSNLEKITGKLNKGELIIGTHVQLGYPMVPEILKEAGFDALWIDTEHTAIDKQELLLNVIITSGSGMAPFVRIPWNDPVLAKPVLEMGPAGIIFPYVRSAEEAKKAISACTYPPKGVRGFGPMRAARYGGMNTLDYMEQVDNSFWKVIQIEHIDAVNDLSGIIAVDGVDAIVIGPNDLAASMGYMGKTDDMEVQKQFDTICELAKRAGTPVGISTGYTGNSDDIKKWMDRGVDFIFLGSDMSMLLQGGLEIKDQIQACKK